MEEKEKTYTHTWEEAIEVLREHPEHKQIVFDAYLTANLIENVDRFEASLEFKETLRLIKQFAPNASAVLDVPGGNGIATYAFAKNGYSVSTVEPDSSATLGRDAIEYVLKEKSLKAEVVNAYGEDLPFEDSTFDIVYVRQGLHHAMDLGKMVSEYYRVLKKDGLLVACREHVVDNKKESLQAFLDSQVDHQLYGGENAFTLKEYTSSMENAGFNILSKIKPYNSPINLHPNTPESLSKKIIDSTPGAVLSKILPAKLVGTIGMKFLNLAKRPGRLYSFIAKK